MSRSAPPKPPQAASVPPEAMDRVATASARSLARMRAGLRPEQDRAAAGRDMLARLAQRPLQPPRVSQPFSPMTLDRINLALTLTAGLDRRIHPRFPHISSCRLDIAGRVLWMRSIDIGSSGLRLMGQGMEPYPVGTQCRLHHATLGEVPVRLRQSTPSGAGLAFVTPLESGVSAALAGLLLMLAGEQTFLTSRARHLAARAQSRLEEALASGDLTEQALFSAHYGADPEGPPPLRAHGAQRFLAPLCREMAHLTARWRPAPAYIRMTDRNGFVACDCHVPACAGARPPVRVPPSRQGRLLGDTPTLRAARFAREAFTHVYGQEGDETDLTMETAAPVSLRGRRWGCLQIGSPVPASPLTGAGAGAEPSPA